MKYIKIGKLMFSLFVCIPGWLQAQTGVQYKTEELQDSLQKLKVAFREVDKRDLLGGVSTLNVSGLLEKNYSTYSLDNLDAFAPGFHGNIWGNNSYLVLIDGIPRDASSVLPTEIENITVLKSAAAVVLYGSRAAKGAILITTKRGESGKQRVSLRANAGINFAKSFPEYLGSAEYMTLYNEAQRNDGLTAVKYSDADIFHHSSGQNPYRYPSVDFYSSDYLNNSFTRYDGTLEVTGGNDKARYYTNVGFYREGSFLNFGEGKESANQRFNVRGNVDVNITKTITSFVDASISFANQKGANVEYFSSAATLRPNAFSPLIPISMIEQSDAVSQGYVSSSSNLIDGKYLLGGTSLNQTNPIAGVYAGGSGNNTNRQLQFSTGVNADLGSVIDGLSFKTVFGLDYLTSYRLSFNNTYATYEPTWTNYAGADLISGFTPYGVDASTRTQNISNNSFRQTSFLSAQFNYQNQFAGKHNVSALLVASGFQQAQSAQYHRVASANLGMNVGYNYEQTYYIDFSGAIIHSARLPENNRRAFSPTVSAAWRLSNEDFLKSSTIVDDLRLLASAGVVHTDLDLTGGVSDGYYLYEGAFRQTGSNTVYYTWKDGLTNTTAVQDRGANPNLRFPKRSEITFGLDGALFNRKLLFNGSYFLSKMEGLVVQNTSAYPSYFTQGYPAASFIPYENYNDEQRTGFDLGINYLQKVGQVDLNLGLTGTYYETKILKRAEPIYNEDYLYRVSRPIDNIFGMETLGFFKDANDVANSPDQSVFGQIKPGDLKYKDQNGDGVINTDDEVYLGRGGWYGSPLTFGLNLTAKYKNFTVFALGVLRNGGVAMRSNSYFWIAGEDKYSEVVRGRWTEATSETATYPRLSTTTRSNNFRNSDFWLYSTNRFDLARVQLTYTLSGKRIKENSLLNGLQIYAQGTNLLTISKNREILELNVGSTPQTRFFNLGVKTSF